MEIQGIIKAVRKNNKGILIKEDWYNFFKENTEYKKGDEVKLDYKLNKGFKNIISIDLLNRPKIKEPKVSNPVTKLDNTTINTILMCAKDIKVAFIDNNIPASYKEIVKQVLDGLETIKL